MKNKTAAGAAWAHQKHALLNVIGNFEALVQSASGPGDVPEHLVVPLFRTKRSIVRLVEAFEPKRSGTARPEGRTRQ